MVPQQILITKRHRAAGALERFLAELAAEGDVLARLAALQQLLELAQHEAVPAVLRAEVAPHIMALMAASDEPPMQQAAIAATAALLRSGEDTALVQEAVRHLYTVLQVCIIHSHMIHAWATCMWFVLQPRWAPVALGSGSVRCDAISPVLHGNLFRLTCSCARSTSAWVSERRVAIPPFVPKMNCPELARLFPVMS